VRHAGDSNQSQRQSNGRNKNKYLEAQSEHYPDKNADCRKVDISKALAR